MKRRSLRASLSALILALFFSAACGVNSAPEAARVTQVIDGDTIILEGGHRVRYIGIDAPERDEPFYQEAKEANQALVEGKRVRLERDISQRDMYGRLLRYVWANGTLVEAELVRQGYAVAKAYPPDTKYQAELEQIERQARETGRGIWSSS